jgi:hypothetical protein
MEMSPPNERRGKVVPGPALGKTLVARPLPFIAAATFSCIQLPRDWLRLVDEYNMWIGRVNLGIDPERDRDVGMSKHLLEVAFRDVVGNHDSPT